MPTDVDKQIARSSEFLDRTRDRYESIRMRARKRREAAILRRVARIAIADALILVAALVIGFVAPIGMGGALLVMALLILTTLLLAIFPRPEGVTAVELSATSLSALPLQTEKWLEAQRPALPAPAKTLVDSIGVRLETLAPQLARLDEREPAAAEVRKLIGEQLPELIEGYGRVPEPLRRVERNGSTPEAQLADSLALIDAEIGTMTEKLAQGDLDLLATRGRYLQIRYRDDDLDVQ